MMARTYKALLRGDRLEWLGEAPQASTGHPLHVQVTVEEPKPAPDGPAKGAAMAALLEKLAERGTFSAISNPVQWQRELREERGLPG